MTDATAEASLEPRIVAPSRCLDVGRDGSDGARCWRREGGARFGRRCPPSSPACASITDGLVVDVGANTGFYSLLAAAFVRSSDCRRRAVSRQWSACSSATSPRNGLNSRIDVLQKALGITGSPNSSYPQRPRSRRDECHVELGFKETFESSVHVDVATLDSMVGIGMWVSSRSMSRALRTSCSMERNGANEHRPFVFLEVLQVREHGRIDRCDERSGTSTFPSRQGASCVVVGGVRPSRTQPLLGASRTPGRCQDDHGRAGLELEHGRATAQ